MVNLIVYAIPLFFLFIGIEILVGKKKRQFEYQFNDALANITCGIGDQVINVFLKGGLALAVSYLYEHHRIFTVPSTVWSFFLLLFIFDFAFYWAHRISHESNFFWGAHAVHHQSEFYNLSVALRQPWLTSTLTFFLFLPIPILGFDVKLLLAVAGVDSLFQFLIHTKYVYKLPAILEFIFNTPSHHRVHHARNPKYIDKNYGGVFIIWDRLFGTFKVEEKPNEIVYGITKPYNNFNPVWANLEHWYNMIKEIKNIHGFYNKIKFLFYKPGFNPNIQGNFTPIPEVEITTYKPFNILIPKGLNKYLLIQAVLLIVGTLVYLYAAGFVKNTLLMVGLAGALLLWTGSMGSILNKRTWSIALEQARLILNPIIITALLFYFLNLKTMLWLAILGTALALTTHLIFLIWVRRYNFANIKH